MFKTNICCVEVCQLGTYTNEGECETCKKCCATCENKKACKSCKALVVFSEGKCEDSCPESNFQKSMC